MPSPNIDEVILRVALAQHLRDSEVEHLEDSVLAFTREKEIRRFEIAMHDSHRVRLPNRNARGHHVADGFLDGELELLFELDGEVVSLKELDHHVGNAFERHVDVDDFCHVRALDGRRGARLAFEALDKLVVNCEARKEHLDRDALPEALMDGLVYDTHPSVAQLRHDAILPRDERTGRKC